MVLFLTVWTTIPEQHSQLHMGLQLVLLFWTQLKTTPVFFGVLQHRSLEMVIWEPQERLMITVLLQCT